MLRQVNKGIKTLTIARLMSEAAAKKTSGISMAKCIGLHRACAMSDSNNKIPSFVKYEKYLNKQPKMGVLGKSQKY